MESFGGVLRVYNRCVAGVRYVVWFGCDSRVCGCGGCGGGGDSVCGDGVCVAMVVVAEAMVTVAVDMMVAMVVAIAMGGGRWLGVAWRRGS